MKIENQPKGKTSTQSPKTAASVNSPTVKMTTLSALAMPFQNPSCGNNNMLPALIEEQTKAARDLESYIAEFARKVDHLQAKPGDAELVILFVMNLQSRWKRLVEPLEPTFGSWTEAARAARYHSAKMTALLGADKVVKESGFTFFGNKESEKLLTSGYFVPENHPRKVDFADREQPATKKDKLGTGSPTVSLPKPAPSECTSRKSMKKGNSGGAATTTTTGKATSTKKASASQQQQQQQYAGAAPLSAMTGYDRRSMLEENIKQVAAELGMPDELQLANVYDQIPPEHRNVQLPFLELKLFGQRVSALLAKNRWGASVMSIRLLKKLNLLLEPEGGCDIATEFGLVTESIGSAFLPLGHPSAPEIFLAPLEVQVLPKLYGGKVDFILGADFFFCFDASFTDVENRKIKFLNRETTFIAKELK